MIVFEEAKQLFSEARMQKYLRACGGDEDQAMQLYSYNARLSQAFFGVVSLFEVILRNAINEHYLKTLGEIKSTNPEVCRSRDFRVLRRQRYNIFLN